MSRSARLWVVALVAVAIVGTASAQVTRFRGSASGNFTAHLSGAGEVPPVETEAAGQAVMSLNADRTEIRFKVLVANIVKVTQSHIHCGAAGVNGPVVAFLFGFIPDGETLDGILAQGKLTETNVIPRPDSAACPGGVADFNDMLAKMESGDAYVNVHTVDHPGGEVRGQIRPPVQ
ncbi:MAG: CHRD domain-containing protein [Gemmatimonadales bacterium]